MSETQAADGCRLFYLDQTPKDPTAAPRTVLWLQGLNAPGSAWAVQLAHFAQSCRSIVPDARGVGKSGAPQGPYSTRMLAEDAVRVLDACGVSRAHVVGLSLGGAAAQELALGFPDRVQSLALLGSFAVQAPRSRALLEAWCALYPLVTSGQVSREAWEAQAYAWLFTDAFWRNPANVRAALRFSASQPLQPADGFVGQAQAALGHDARARLGQLRLPVAVIHGETDQLAPISCGRELAELIPGAALTVLPGVGHAVNLEGQRTVHAALRELWGREG